MRPRAGTRTGAGSSPAARITCNREGTDDRCPVPGPGATHKRRKRQCGLHFSRGGICAADGVWRSADGSWRPTDTVPRRRALGGGPSVPEVRGVLRSPSRIALPQRPTWVSLPVICAPPPPPPWLCGFRLSGPLLRLRGCFTASLAFRDLSPPISYPFFWEPPTSPLRYPRGHRGPRAAKQSHGPLPLATESRTAHQRMGPAAFQTQIPLRIGSLLVKEATGRTGRECPAGEPRFESSPVPCTTQS